MVWRLEHFLVPIPIPKSLSIIINLPHVVLGPTLLRSLGQHNSSYLLIIYGNEYLYLWYLTIVKQEYPYMGIGIWFSGAEKASLKNVLHKSSVVHYRPPKVLNRPTTVIEVFVY